MRAAHGTAAGTHAANLEQQRSKWSALVLSTGSDCWQSMSTVPGKPVLFWTDEPGEQPMLTVRASRARSLLQLNYPSPLVQQVMTQSDFLHDHGCHKGTSQPVCCQPAMHTILTSAFARHVAGELSQAGFMLAKACVAIGGSRSASEARRELRHMLSSSLVRYTARAGPGAIAELCVATTWRWRASRARGGRGMTWAGGWARNSVSGRVMPAPMCSSPGSARDEDKCAGRSWDTSVAYLGLRSEGPRLHVVRN